MWLPLGQQADLDQRPGTWLGVPGLRVQDQQEGPQIPALRQGHLPLSRGPQGEHHGEAKEERPQAQLGRLRLSVGLGSTQHQGSRPRLGLHEQDPQGSQAPRADVHVPPVRQGAVQLKLTDILAWCRRLPSAFWAALGAGLTILLLVLRSRKQEAEIARLRLREQAAQAKAVGARAQGARQAHVAEAERARASAEALEAQTRQIQLEGEAERQEIDTLSSDEVQRRYQEQADTIRLRARSRKN